MKRLSLVIAATLAAVSCAASVAYAVGNTKHLDSSEEHKPKTQTTKLCDNSNRCRQVKNDCIACCSNTHLPTCDHGFGFQNCVNKCMQDKGCLAKSEGGKE